MLKNKTDKDGTVITSDLIAQIRPELINKKKAELIKKKMTGNTLEEVAKNSNVTVNTANSITMASPLISGVGNEPGVVGAMSTMELNKVSDLIEGDKGVFKVKVTNRTEPVELENYENFRKQIISKLAGRSYQLYQVLEDKADIVDNRAKFF